MSLDNLGWEKGAQRIILETDNRKATCSIEKFIHFYSFEPLNSSGHSEVLGLKMLAAY